MSIYKIDTKKGESYENSCLCVRERWSGKRPVFRMSCIFYYTRQGVPASLYSFDGQYKNRNTDKKVSNPDVAIVDTPGRIMDTKTTQTIEGADMVVVPVRHYRWKYRSLY